MEIRLTAPARQWIVDKTCADRNYGARPLRRALQKYVEDPLSEALMQGHLRAASVVEVFLADTALDCRALTSAVHHETGHETDHETEEMLTH
jgi:ATP-dependent Clp protease ATP-binding subunit ClpC